ncbi:MAG TPA: class I SAM-dependent methyltransferase [Terriglobales bacterium]|nr:class I SAM-dependent methyltransferase [Terriglobales bacterium]
MNLNEYTAMYRLEDTYWWFVARRRLVAQLLRERQISALAEILDVGCGTGATLELLQRFGRATGVDSHLPALEICSLERGVPVQQAQAEELPFPDHSFDVVTCLDVLEHTDDDIVALREIHRVCAPEAIFIAMVPAYGFLWSEHDEALKHRRRYTAHELRNKMTSAGFDVVSSTYFITLLFFPILAVRLWQGLFKKNIYPQTAIRELPAWLNRFFVGLLDIERFLTRFLNLPFGVSLVVVGTPAQQFGDHPLTERLGDELMIEA